MRLLLKVHLRGRQVSRLQRIYDETACPRTRIRVQMVLLSRDGYTITDIAVITQQSDETVRRWLHRFEQAGCLGLLEGQHSGRPPTITSRVEVFLQACILRSPREFGFDRATWTTALLAEAVAKRFKLEVTDECVRQHLQQLELVCRRPTWSVKHLAEQQPGYAQKKGLSHGFYSIRRGAPMSTLKTRPS